LRSAAVVFLFGGIAAVLALLWQLSPPLKPEPRMGALESRYRDEVMRAFAAADLSAPTCHYYAKQLLLACTTPTYTEAKLLHVLGREGWIGSDGGARLQGSQDAASFGCRTKESPSACELRIWFRRDRR
jgi:hypothetical protein